MGDDEKMKTRSQTKDKEVKPELGESEDKKIFRLTEEQFQELGRNYESRKAKLEEEKKLFEKQMMETQNRMELVVKMNEELVANNKELERKNKFLIEDGTKVREKMKDIEEFNQNLKEEIERDKNEKSKLSNDVEKLRLDLAQAFAEINKFKSSAVTSTAKKEAKSRNEVRNFQTAYLSMDDSMYGGTVISKTAEESEDFKLELEKTKDSRLEVEKGQRRLAEQKNANPTPEDGQLELDEEKNANLLPFKERQESLVNQKDTSHRFRGDQEKLDTQQGAAANPKKNEYLEFREKLSAHALEFSKPETLSPTLLESLKRLEERIDTSLKYAPWLQSQTQPKLLESNIPMKIALHDVPRFDGKNIPVSDFVRACKRAREMTQSSPEASFIKWMKSKLVGQAYSMIEDNEFNTVKEILDRLTSLYGPSKSIAYYRNEVVNLRKKVDESIIDYIVRTKDIRSAIQEIERSTYGQISPVTASDKEILESFLFGLPTEYRIELKLAGTKSLKETFEEAIEIDRRMIREKEKTSNSSEFKQLNRNNNIQTGRNNLYCEICKRTNHSAENCFYKNGNGRQNEPTTAPRNTTAQNLAPSQPNYGNQQSRDTQNLRQEPYRNSNNNSGNNPNNGNSQVRSSRRPMPLLPTCGYCSKIGHTIDECYKKQNDDRRRLQQAGKNKEDQGNEQGPSGLRGSYREATATNQALPIQSIEQYEQQE